MGNKILLIDNSVPLGQSVKFILSRTGYDIDMIDSEDKAIVKLKTGNYGLVIIDLKNFDLYGNTAIRFIRSEGDLIHNPPVLILSVPEIKDTVDTAVFPGKVDWLMIPFSNEKLLASVRKLWK